MALTAACTPLDPARLAGEPVPERTWNPALEQQDSFSRKLTIENSPWAALTWQGESKIRSTLGRPLSLPLETDLEAPPDVTEEWLAQRSPGLARPFLDALGWKAWLKGPEIAFDGRRLRTPLERLEAWHQGWPEPEDERPTLVSVRLYPLGPLRDRPVARLFLRPNRALRITLDQDRSSLLLRRELTSWLEAESGCSVRFARTGEFQAHLGASALLGAGWRVQARLGSDIDRTTLSAPHQEPGSASLGLVFTTSCTF